MVLTAKSQTSKRLFYAKDLIFYFIAVTIIAGLFLGFVILPNSSTSFSGFKVAVDNKTVLTYSFDGELYVTPEYQDKVEYSISGEVFTATIISTTHNGGYNVIKIDKAKKTATVLESNCSNSKDCVYSPDISNKGAIYCAPHALKITAIGGNEFIPPTVG